MEKAPRFWLACLALAAVLLALQLWFLPLPGLQQDEALFLRPFLQGDAALSSLTIGRARVPVMLMDYVGCLKTWLYWPLIRAAPLNVWSIRLPVCLVSVGALLLLAALARSVTDTRVALSAAALLATDATFVLTNVFDWGPVALLIAGALGVMALLVRFGRSGSRRALGAACLLAGALLWSKAIFVFPLAGILIACVAIYPRSVWRLVTGANLAVATASLLLGASPLLLYNLQTGAATFQAATRLESIPLSEKLLMLRLTLDGKALEHYMVRSEPHEILALSGAPLGELVGTWYRTSHLGLGSFLFPALLACAVALPFVRRSPLFRPILFAWVAGLSTEALFLISGNGGAGPHHTVLLFPAPQFIVAATLAAIADRGNVRRRALVTCVIVLVAASNFALLGNYHRAALANGFSVYWTDAVGPLAAALRAQNQPVAVLDWGIADPAQIDSGNALPIVQPAPARPGVLYVTHGANYQVDASQTRQLIGDATAGGLVVTSPRTIADSHGNPVFSVFSLQPEKVR